MTMTSPGSRSPTAPIRMAARGRRPGGRSDDADEAPLRSARGDALPHRAAIALAKSAQLLPAVLMVPVSDPPRADAADPGPALTQMATEAALLPVAAARLPPQARWRTRSHIFRPDDGEAPSTPPRSSPARISRRRFISFVSPAMCVGRVPKWRGPGPRQLHARR